MSQKKKVVKSYAIKLKKAAPKKAYVSRVYFATPLKKKKAPGIHRGWKIYTDSHGKFVTGRFLIIKGRKVRRVISGSYLASIKVRIDKLYNAGAKDAR
jgi:hypothetical protein